MIRQVILSYRWSMNRIAAALLSLVTLTACTGPDPINTTLTPQPSDEGSARSERSEPAVSPSSPRLRLNAIDHDVKSLTYTKPQSCDDLLATLKTHGTKNVTAYGFNDGIFPVQDIGIGKPATGQNEPSRGDEQAAVADSVAGSAQAAGPDNHSDTNIQEEGVGEFTTSLTNGKIIATVRPHDGLFSRSDRIQLIDPETLEDLATLDLPKELSGGEIKLAFADSSTLLAISNVPSYAASRVVLARLDVQDPKHPTVTSSLRLNGYLSGARLIDGQVIIAATSTPHGLAFKTPEDQSIRSEREAIDHNTKVIEDSTIDQWLPDAEIADQQGQRVQQHVVDCNQTWLADSDSLAFTSVSSVDTTGSTLTLHPGAAVNGYGDRIYSSSSRLISWQQPWSSPQESVAHLVSFDISTPDHIRVKATGSVKGQIDTTWALDEQDGIVRTASTFEDGGKQVSRATILQEQGDALVPVGQLDNLGRDEEIKSVRWLTPELGVVVTFKQTDPVYTIDTRDPSSPKVAGELKIPGYSAYLHPVGDHQLLGIGQQADPETGQTKGFKYSLFDIRDVANPKELDVREFSGGSSNAEYDHHGFTWFNDKGYTVIGGYNLAEHGPEETAKQSLLVSGIKTDDGKLVELGRGELRTEYGYEGAQTMVIGDKLFVVSRTVIGKYDANSVAQERQRELAQN